MGADGRRERDADDLAGNLTRILPAVGQATVDPQRDADPQHDPAGNEGYPARRTPT